MVAIDAQLFGSSTPQLVQIVVTGLVGTESVSVWAEPPSSERRVVRGGVDVDPTSDALVLVDPMPELGRPIIYVVEWTAGGVRSQLSAEPVTVPDPGRHVLSDPFTGEAVLVDVVLDDDERTGELRGSTLYPVGSRYGVAILDGRTADVGTLTAYASSRVDAAALVELLDAPRPLVSRHPNDGCDIAALEVLSVGSATRRRRSRAGDRVFELPYQLAHQPDPTLALSVVTLADLAAYYEPAGTLADLAADTATLLDIGTREWVA